MYNRSLAAFLFVSIVWAPFAHASQDCTSCVPVSTVHESELFNPCSRASTGDYCVDTIRKTTQHTIYWPDGTLQSAWLTAYGRSACAGSCMKDWIGAPWTHRDCWPEFYTPIRSTRNYYAAAADNSTDVIMRWCYAMSYVAAVFCTGPIGPQRYISINHLCLDCPSDDRDQDGFVSSAAGGDDCNDSYPFIHPGAPLICYPGYDADCNGMLDYLEPQCTNSPIVIDLGRNGITLTSKDGGVAFDLDADGNREQLSWTAAEADDAWLCLDRNGNRAIDDGRELFGSYTNQPDPPQGVEPNGFLALAVFDNAENGGNGNGIIDGGDAVYRNLLLWRDSNHNGISETNELMNLSSYGVIEISLDYKLSRKVDEYGNQFRYRAKLKLQNGAGIARWAWDVFLLR
jgi:hypothetical protein